VPHLEYAGMSLRFSVGAEHVTANNLETDDGDDPNPEINR